MFVCKDPLADIQAVAVNRKSPIFHGIRDENRNQFFGKLVWTIVIGASRDQSRQAVGLVVSEDQEIGCGFACRIRTCGIQRSIFAKRTGWTEAAINLVR